MQAKRGHRFLGLVVPERPIASAVTRAQAAVIDVRPRSRESVLGFVSGETTAMAVSELVRSA
jgi:hypothetical protein